MTGLHPYIWALYCETGQGELVLKYFEELPDKYAECSYYLEALSGTYHVDDALETGEWNPPAMPEDVLDALEKVKTYASSRDASTPEQARQLLLDLTSERGPTFGDGAGEFQLDPELALAHMPLLSLGLHLAHPEVFVPYGFSGNHWVVDEFSREFGVALPPVPSKQDRAARWAYFYDYSAALHAFRDEQGMSQAELLAFLNDFVPMYFTDMEAQLPEPLNAWMLIGGPYEEGDKGIIDALTEEDDPFAAVRWQGNLNMQRGDVALMYLYSPLKQVYALCRVVRDGYLDPFFYYKQAVQVGHFQKVPPLSFAELSAGPVMQGSGLVARRMQGASGSLLTQEEYGEIMGALVARGFPAEAVPQLPSLPDTEAAHLQNERDVEVQLMEPLLARLGLGEGDWVRQLPIRMGRGERNYPDYALGVAGQFPDQRARALIEVKHRTAHERDWREAFLQAKSYALRLQARALLLASADGLRLYKRRGSDFQFETGEALSWADVVDGKASLSLKKALT